MIFTQQQVWQVVKVKAPLFGFDPWLVMAINEQETEHNIGLRNHRVFDRKQYDASVPRMEPDYYQRYIRDFEYSTVVEGMLAQSYGTMQVMGESLRECKNEAGQNFYEWHLSRESIWRRLFYGDAMSSFNVASALDQFCADLDVGIEWGCRWLVEMKRRANSPRVNDWLLKWNGGGDKTYDDQVLTREPRLKVECIS